MRALTVERGVLLRRTGAALLLTAFGLAGSARAASRPAPPPKAVAATVTLAKTPAVRAIPPGFLGVSLEYKTVSAYEGNDAATANPALAELLENLTPGQTPILRIGGDSTDWTWWPIPGITPPRGLNNGLTPDWLARARLLLDAIRARAILGINLEANSSEIASVEAQQLVKGLGRSHIAALEIGNEPMLYPVLPWYHTADGKRVYGRPRTYALSNYTSEFARFATALPNVPLAGPGIGHSWVPQLVPFITAAPRLSIVTLHAYAINSLGAAFRGRNCSTATLTDPAHPTPSALLAPFASTGLTRGFAPAIALAHRHGLTVRVDEMNAITCAGTPGVSDTFASALWALNTLFVMAQAGVDGVNIHTWRGSAGRLFDFQRLGGEWVGTVRPEYYGLLFFAQAAPSGSHLLAATATGGAPIESWATVGQDRRTRVVLINHSLTTPVSATVRVPLARGTATLVRLRAPTPTATDGVTLAGQSFGETTTTGSLAGPYRHTTLTATSAGYTVRLPPATAALLTVPS